ncbi:uncharacterized protein ACRADG_009170 isoform 1-T1 [Cochliomyia hominivorax]
MDVSNSGDEKTECDSISALELQKTKRILYFSDGVLEELSESDEEDIGPDITDKNIDANIDFAALPLVSRIKYEAYQIGCHFINGIDYVGEGLASFFGITTPKYISESDIENAIKGNCCTYDLDTISHQSNVGNWQNNNNKNISNVIKTTCPQNSENNLS